MLGFAPISTRPICALPVTGTATPVGKIYFDAVQFAGSGFEQLQDSYSGFDAVQESFSGFEAIQ